MKNTPDGREADGDEKARTRESEASALRDEWERLEAEGAGLAGMTALLEHSDDLVALRMHLKRVLDHHIKLHKLTKAMLLFIATR